VAARLFLPVLLARAADRRAKPDINFAKLVPNDPRGGGGGSGSSCCPSCFQLFSRYGALNLPQPVAPAAFEFYVAGAVMPAAAAPAPPAAPAVPSSPLPLPPVRSNPPALPSTAAAAGPPSTHAASVVPVSEASNPFPLHRLQCALLHPFSHNRQRRHSLSQLLPLLQRRPGGRPRHRRHPLRPPHRLLGCCPHRGPPPWYPRRVLRASPLHHDHRTPYRSSRHNSRPHSRNNRRRPTRRRPHRLCMRMPAARSTMLAPAPMAEDDRDRAVHPPRTDSSSRTGTNDTRHITSHRHRSNSNSRSSNGLIMSRSCSRLDPLLMPSGLVSPPLSSALSVHRAPPPPPPRRSVSETAAAAAAAGATPMATGMDLSSSTTSSSAAVLSSSVQSVPSPSHAAAAIGPTSSSPMVPAVHALDSSVRTVADAASRGSSSCSNTDTIDQQRR
jgi:hypothetical protein